MVTIAMKIKANEDDDVIVTRRRYPLFVSKTRSFWHACDFGTRRYSFSFFLHCKAQGSQHENLGGGWYMMNGEPRFYTPTN